MSKPHDPVGPGAAGKPSGEPSAADSPTESVDFIREIVADDFRTGKHDHVVTRFPPEPNGFLHIGHAKSICLNFGIAEENDGVCHLRFDDTNPVKEDPVYVASIKEDVRWLGYDWKGKLFHASDYFERLYELAEKLIEKGMAYVDDSTEDEIRAQRGTVKTPGEESPYRDRAIEENLDLFGRMRAGEFEDGSKVLRAKIDMAHPNMKMRDPLLYRVRHATHHQTGDEWCIYPFYDFAHPLSDYVEGITHSLCTLEFEVNRPLYDWYLDQLVDEPHPRQIEFARLNISYTLLSKRKLLQLVQEGIVSGWNDPRMFTISAYRRRGYTPTAIRAFCDRIGVAKRDSLIDHGLLDFYVREELNRTSPRVMAVLRPLKLVITNYPEGEVEEFEAVNNPEDESAGTRMLPFSREIFIERDDFMEDPPRKFFRLAPGREVRLKHAYLVTCDEVIKDEHDEVVELRCSYDPQSRGGNAPDGRRVQGTLHWVSAAHAIDAEVRLYEQLFTKETPGDDQDGGDFHKCLNPNSLEALRGCKLEPSLADAEPEFGYQFLRHGYFCADNVESKPGALVFNRTVSLRDSWAKIQKQ